MMQTPPAPPALAQPSAAQSGVSGTPAPMNVVGSRQLATPAQSYTAAEIAALRQRGDELSRQLSSADSRRRGIQNRLSHAEGADRAGLEQRLTVLDNRIARLELDIEENGRALASPAAAKTMATTGTQAGMARFANAVTPVGVVFTVLVLFPLAIARARRLWKHSDAPRNAPLSADTAQRLERMEQGIDAIAIEVERVSEGQRFITRIMSERGGAPSLAAGESPMEPLRVAASEGVGVAR